MTSPPKGRARRGKNVPIAKADGITTGGAASTAPALLSGWTAGSIAQKLSARWPDEKATVIRVRHWTKEALLRPLGDVHPGTGSALLFGDDAIPKAAILAVIADRGISVVGLPREALQAALTLASNAFRQFEATHIKGRPFTQWLAFLDGPRGLRVEIYSAPPSDPSAESVFTINLDRLFQSIRRA